MLYQDVLDMIPSHWDRMAPNQRFCNVQLSTHSDEYQDVAKKFGTFYYYDRTCYRVQNPLLWAKFMLKKEEFQKRGEYEILTLFHDTAVANVDSICEFNLDWRMGERFMFGPGVYFSVEPHCAFKHSSKNNGPLRAMFIFDVLVHKLQKVDNEVFLPNPGYDTILSHKKQTYVKYFDDLILEMIKVKGQLLTL